MTQIATSGSLRALMDELVSVEGQVRADVESEFGFKVYGYRWRPRGVPDLPCIYNWLIPSPGERHTVAHWRDQMNLTANCAVRWTDVDTEMDQLEKLSDQFRHVVDAALNDANALNSLPHRIDRISGQSASDRFNDIPVLLMQFTIRAELDRQI